jgi:hypothetical protein
VVDARSDALARVSLAGKHPRAAQQSLNAFTLRRTGRPSPTRFEGCGARFLTAGG